MDFKNKIFNKSDIKELSKILEDTELFYVFYLNNLYVLNDESKLTKLFPNIKLT